jgi:hypothetical protein
LISITGLPRALKQYSLRFALELGVAISFYPNAIAIAMENPLSGALPSAT